MSTFCHRMFTIVIFTLLGVCSFPALSMPAGVEELTIDSHGSRMSGFIYKAAGEGLHPTVLLLHGYPGNEKNLDVAQALRSKGWNVLFFHYRGAWGSEGDFSFLGAERDVQVVLDYMNANAQRLTIDKNKISIVGHSMGGHMAIAGILGEPSVKCAVAYDGANLGANNAGFFTDDSLVRRLSGYDDNDEFVTAKMWEEYSDTLFMLRGWNGKKAREESEKHGHQLNLLTRVENINGRPVLFIPADTGVIPMALHITPLIKALKSTANSKIFSHPIIDDHSFSSSRDKLINATAAFLNEQCL
ncbi:alpha/beta hydrolase family protein [Colwelliaceae bacterium 6471]